MARSPIERRGRKCPNDISSVDANSFPAANGLGYRVTTVYDAASQRTALVDAMANRYTFLYDNGGRNRAQVDPLARRTTYAYDAGDQLTLRLDARGYRTTYAYDNAGNLMARKYPDASRVTFVYDAVNQQRVAQDGTGRYTTMYDALGRTRATADVANQRVTYVYDALNQRRYITDPDGGRFTYVYDAGSQLTYLANPQGDRTTYTYDNDGRRTVQRNANGTRASYTYDDASRLTSLGNLKSDNSVLSSFDYAYDNTLNRTRVVESNGDRVTWTYDNTYQLTRERRSGATSYDITYVYDAVGNRTLQIDSTARTTYAYDAANQTRYSQDGTGRTTFTFDSAGNQRIELSPALARTTNVWDYENRRRAAIDPSTGATTFTYRPDALRVKSQDGSSTTKFIWDEQRVLAETDNANASQVVYTSEPAGYGNLVAQRRLSAGIWTPYVHLYDALGSTDRLTDSTQAVANSYIYKAFGVLAASSGSVANVAQFVGQLGYATQAAGTYVQARWYQPPRGRWLSFDPLLFADGATLWNLFDEVTLLVTRLPESAGPRQLLPRLLFLRTQLFGLSLYNYSGNNPVRSVDPSGLQPYGDSIPIGPVADLAPLIAGLSATLAALKALLLANVWNIAIAIAISAAIACIVNQLRVCVPGYRQCAARAVREAGLKSSGICPAGFKGNFMEAREINHARCINRLYNFIGQPCDSELASCMVRCGIGGYTQPNLRARRIPMNICDAFCADIPLACLNPYSVTANVLG